MAETSNRLSAACSMVAAAECIQTGCHNALSAVSGPHDGSDAWPDVESSHPMKLFKRRAWNDDSPITDEEMDTAKSLVKSAISHLEAWLLEVE